MGKKAEKDAGSIYRLHKGELRKLYPNITIPNAICFSPDRAFAYFCDTTSQIVQRQALDEENGWPKGDPEPYLNLTSKDQNPDGAVIDKTGNMWLALWGSSCVSCFNPEGDGRHGRAHPRRRAGCGKTLLPGDRPHGTRRTPIHALNSEFYQRVQNLLSTSEIEIHCAIHEGRDVRQYSSQTSPACPPQNGSDAQAQT